MLPLLLVTIHAASLLLPVFFFVLVSSALTRGRQSINYGMEDMSMPLLPPRPPPVDMVYKVVWKLEDPAVLARERQQREQEKVMMHHIPNTTQAEHYRTEQNITHLQ